MSLRATIRRIFRPENDEYNPVYTSGRLERDGAHHQGTVWPWLIGPFVEAWLRVNGIVEGNIKQVKETFNDEPAGDHVLRCTTPTHSG
ncbi:hypothetical protein N9L06_05065 [Mariniblastus sp.]|nr:hypothetical protein [Mariniblastus sp.]